MAGFRTSIQQWPSFRGADPFVDGRRATTNDPYRYPFECPTDHNQIWGCVRGIETWTADSYVGHEEMFPDLTLVHCYHGTNFNDQDEATTLRWRILGDFAQIQIGDDIGYGAAFGVTFKDGYEFGHTHVGMEVRGYDAAYRQVLRTVRHESYSRFIDCTFECPTIVYQPLGIYGRRSDRSWAGLWQGCVFLPVAGHLTFAAGWYPKYDIGAWLGSSINDRDQAALAMVRYQIRPWRDGRDLDVYHWFQSADFELPPITAPWFYGDLPPGVSSNAALIALGTPIFGAVLPQTAEPFGDFFFAAPGVP